MRKGGLDSSPFRLLAYSSEIANCNTFSEPEQ